jgi:ABC-type multidrug transport system fused ATPase/permease subunit
MKQLPAAEPGVPDHRSATRYLLWVARAQSATMWVAVALGVTWMVAQALMPTAVGLAIDALTGRDMAGLARWSLALLALGLVQAAAGITRHRFAVTNWLGAAYRTVQVTAQHAARLGATLPKRVATGEVVSIGTSDIGHIGNAMDITARGAGAVVALVTVTVILLHASLPLGLVVVLGVPLLMAIVGSLLRPLHKRQQAYRDLSGKLTGRAGDIVAGLRVLRGVGGEGVFVARYRAESQELRAAGVRVSRVDSVLHGFQVLLPGSFVVLVTWLAARFAVDGRITPGQLVAFYGYAMFLTHPLWTLTEMADKLTRGHVSARRVVRILALQPEIAEPAQSVAPRRGDHELVDPDSGVVIRPGLLTAIAAATPEEAVAIADRLGRYTDSAARLDGVPLRELAVAAVRERIVVADNDARLFSGPLRDELDPRGTRDRDALAAALHAASAADIIAALPEGLDMEVVERGREFSGGQQQRLRLVRALLADPPILVLVEPTSAVDAHTEARIANRLGAARSGRTTVVCTTSPLLLDRADHVVYVDGGRVRAEGTHRDLLDSSPQYRATVTRGEDDQ